MGALGEIEGGAAGEPAGGEAEEKERFCWLQRAARSIGERVAELTAYNFDHLSSLTSGMVNLRGR